MHWLPSPVRSKYCRRHDCLSWMIANDANLSKQKRIGNTICGRCPDTSPVHGSPYCARYLTAPSANAERHWRGKSSRRSCAVMAAASYKMGASSSPRGRSRAAAVAAEHLNKIVAQYEVWSQVVSCSQPVYQALPVLMDACMTRPPITYDVFCLRCSACD